MSDESKMKVITVKSVDWTHDVEVDSNIFEDVFIEACTKVLEENLKNKNTRVGIIMEACLKSTPKKIYTINTYKILINAGFHQYAENLRKNYKKQTKSQGKEIDVKDEPIKV